MGSMLLALLGSVGSLFGGLFQAKGIVKSSAIGGITDMVSKIAQADANSNMAAALPIVAEASSGSWLAVNWRPLTMMVFLAMIVSYWFGYSPKNLTADDMTHLWYLLTCGICGYSAQRTVEKVMDKINIGRVATGVLKQKLGVVGAGKDGTDDSDEDAD